MENNVRVAREIVVSCLNIEEGESVWISSWDHTVDLASELAFLCRQRGARPFVTLVTENYWMRSLQEIPKTLLETLSPFETAALEQTDVFIFLLGPKTPIDWSKIPSEKQELANVWFLESNRYMDAWRELARKRSVRTLGVEYCWATRERAQALGLDYEEWKNVMLAGCLANQQVIAQRASYLAEIVRGGQDVNVATPSGTRLKFRLIGREPNVGDSVVSKEDGARGIVKFLPSGFVEVAADEDSAEGAVVYDATVLVRGGGGIKNLTLQFRRGKIVQYSAQSGIEAFESYLKSGDGDLGKFAFFGIGLNAGLRHGFTQDDKALGGVTVGVGANEDKGGRNRTLGNRGWWGSMTKATLSVDGKTILREGLQR
jgi:leucyl aminopeptidase (aminopeptidase T)